MSSSATNGKTTETNLLGLLGEKKGKKALRRAGREGVQRTLAIGLLIVLAASLFAGLGLIVTKKWTGVTSEDINTYFQIGFTPLFALVSAATGFYFGSGK